MAVIAVQRVPDAQKRTLPVFEEIERMLGDVKQRAFDLFRSRGAQLGHALDDWLQAEREVLGWPAAQLKEAGQAYDLQVTLPGFDAKEVQVTATPAEIIVHAQTKNSDQPTEETPVVWTQFGRNDVYRRFELACPIDVDRVTASLDKGILRITAPKAEPVKREIAISTTA